jgi:uncharacterized protein (TIGR00661 family)
MRIVYGVHGYGRGHATRTLAVLPHLAAHHRVLVVAGGDAYQAIAPDYNVVRIPTLGFAYDIGRGPRRRSNWQTFRHNLPGMLDLVCGGPTLALVRDAIAEFAPDLVIADAEAYTHHAAAALKIPRIGFDHIGIMTHCRPELAAGDWLESWVDTSVYRLLVGRPERVIVSSFYHAEPRRPGIRVVGTLPRQEIRGLRPRRGEHLLVYLNRGRDQLHAGILRTLEEVGCPVHIYGTPRRGRVGALTFLPPSNLPFLEDLASCRAVVSTAGNQLVGEAMFLGKPILVFPERCVEQRMNALAVERLGIGMRADFRDFTPTRLRAFLQQLDGFSANIARHVRDGLPEALAALEQFLGELSPTAAGARWSASRAPDAETAGARP